LKRVEVYADLEDGWHNKQDILTVSMIQANMT